MPAMTLPKRSGESRLYTLDFSRLPEIQGGDRVAAVDSVVVDVEPNQNAQTQDVVVSSIAVTAAAKGAQFVLAGGTSGTRYRVLVIIRTVNGSILEGVGYLAVDDT